MSGRAPPPGTSPEHRPTKPLKVENGVSNPIWVAAVTPAPSRQDSVLAHRALEDPEPTLTDEQRAAVELASEGRNLFLTGQAGSGKTTALKAIIARLRGQQKRVRIAAPTGKAALGIGGSTLHSLFGLTPKKMEFKLCALERMIGMNETLRQRLADTDVLVIDEISMVEKNFVDRLSRLMIAAKEDKDDLNFGGVQLIVCGDFRQLSPVKPFSYCFDCGVPNSQPPKKERNRAARKTEYRCERCHRTEDENKKWAFDADAWAAADFVNVNLKGNLRQSGDALRTLVNDLGRGVPPNERQRELLRTHACDVQDGIYLYSTTKEVDEMNDSQFAKLRTAQIDHQCIDDFLWRREQHPQLRHMNTVSQDGRTLVELAQHQYKPTLKLKIGMPVVLTQNLDVENKLVNGSQGTIVDLQYFNENNLPRIFSGRESSEPDNQEAERRANGNVFRGGEVSYYRAEQIKKFVVQHHADVALPVVKFVDKAPMVVFPDCQVTLLGDEDDPPYSILSRTQIPLDIGYAMTIHKSQGMTMDKVIVDLSRIFCAGQAYVALSRPRTFEGLKVIGNYNGLDKIGVDREVEAFMARTVWYTG